MPSLLESVATVLGGSGVDLDALARAWARVTPTVAIVPAFGLKALPLPARGVLALAMAASIFPALTLPTGPAHATTFGGTWIAALLLEALRGLPIAIAAAVPLWAATMAGGLIDTLRGANETAALPVVEGRASSFGLLFSLLASSLFLASGGPSRVALALATRAWPSHPIVSIAEAISSGVGLAVAIAAPLVAAAIVLEVASALIARAATPAQIQSLIAPLRSMALLVVVAVAFDRVAIFLARTVGDVP